MLSLRGLAVNVGHGRAEIADAVRAQVRSGLISDDRQFSNPLGRLAAGSPNSHR